MTKSTVTVFSNYPFTVGEKIHIADGPRKGDWQVIGLSDKKVRLRCPVSGIEVEWARFCYLTENAAARTWPGKS